MSSIILEARDIRYRYPGGMEAISGMSFHFRKREKIALVGPNGAGKSTLLSMFNGMIKPVSGIMLFDSEPMQYDRTSLRILRKRVGFALQNPDRQIIAPTVYQDVAFGPTNLGFAERQFRDAVTLALRQVGLEGFERRPSHHLSGGEKKRVAIAGVLVMDPDVLVFDEPTSGLDPAGSEDIMELLDELNHDGKTVVISTHDVELAYPWADRVILMVDGKILCEDVPDVAFGDPEIVRMAHLSLPTLLELHFELQKRGLPLSGKKPRTILDMMNSIESMMKMSANPVKPGTITVCNVDKEDREILLACGYPASWIRSGRWVPGQNSMRKTWESRLTSRMASSTNVFLRLSRAENSLILTTGSMVPRISQRVEAYGRESGTHIEVRLIECENSPSNPDAARP